MSATRAGLALVATALSLGVAWVDEPAVVPSADRTCGVALGLFASDPGWDYGPMLEEIADHGATGVLLSVPWVQSGLTASTLGPRPGHSPSAETLARTLDQAAAHGLAVSLMPVVRLETRAPGVWRGALQPADRAAWFDAYGGLLLAHAEVAEAHGVARLVVGSELSSLEDDPRWPALIAATRARTAARLTWSANWDRFEQVPFWGDLDEVGVSAWFELGGRPEAAWAAAADRLEAVSAATGKPVLLTEVGFPARASAAVRPWDHAGPAAPRPALQARLFDAFFDHAAAWPVASGAFVWNWFGHGGTLDSGYSPRGRPAAAVMKRHYRRWCG